MQYRGDPSLIRLGLVGKEILTDGQTTAGKGPYAIVLVLADTIFDHITEENCTPATGGMDSVTLKAGMQYFGIISEVKITTGLVAVYKA